MTDPRASSGTRPVGCQKSVRPLQTSAHADAKDAEDVNRASVIRV
jgi:hypothetical protein